MCKPVNKENISLVRFRLNWFRFKRLDNYQVKSCQQINFRHMLVYKNHHVLVNM